MTTTMLAPSTVAPGSKVFLPDGTSTTVDANSHVTVDTNFVAAMTNAGYTSAGTASSPTIGIGYQAGAGGAVTQATSKSTGVTLNTVTGAITMNNAALAAGVEVTFTLTNSAIKAHDTVSLSMAGGGTSGAYLYSSDVTGAGSVDITLSNASAGSLSEAVVLQFNVIRGQIS